MFMLYCYNKETQVAKPKHRHLIPLIDFYAMCFKNNLIKAVIHLLKERKRKKERKNWLGIENLISIRGQFL